MLADAGPGEVRPGEVHADHLVPRISGYSETLDRLTGAGQAGRMRALAGLAAVVLLAICACGSAGGPAAGPSSRPAGPGASSPAGSGPASASPAGAASLCGGPDAPSRLVTIRTSDGVRLAGFEAGAGSRGVVLVPETGSTGKCGWWPYAAYLARRGFHVLAFDQRCQGSSGCPVGDSGQDLLADIAAAVRTERGAGASRIALLGASQGGSEVLIAAGRPARGPDSVPEVAGVAALSADELDQQLAARPGPQTAVAAAATVRVPVLLAVAPDDRYVSLTETRALFAGLGTPAAGKRLLVQPAGAGHGWLMLDGTTDGSMSPLATQLAAFLKAVTA
jgi:alpha-beta hydrolase superfamily lysophospholipase